MTVLTPAGSNPLAYSLSPPALLLFAEQLYGRAPKAVVLSIAGERFGIGEALSPVVRRALPRAIPSTGVSLQGTRPDPPQGGDFPSPAPGGP